MVWLTLIFIVALVLLLMKLSDGAKPTWMHCRDRRIKYGTPKKIDCRLPGGGYQPVKPEGETDEVLPPPKNR